MKAINWKHWAIAFALAWLIASVTALWCGWKAASLAGAPKTIIIRSPIKP